MPGVPDSGDVTGRAGDLGNWITGQGSAFFVIVLCLIGALIVMSMLKRPFVRGLLVGGVILAVLIMAFK